MATRIDSSRPAGGWFGWHVDIPLGRKIGFSLAALAGLHCLQPLSWGLSAPALWLPAAGLGLALVAWFGPMAGLLVFVDGVLAALQGWLAGTVDGRGAWTAVGDGLMLAAALPAGWWFYHHVALGARRLSDPRSAILFLVIIGFGTAGLLAAGRLGLAVVVGAAPLSAPYMAAYWLGPALGLLVLAPPILAVGTPWLVRRGWATPEVVDESLAAYRAPVGVDRMGTSAWIEAAVLGGGAAALGVLLALAQGDRILAGWQLWGAPLLLIVWASVRDGQRGGTCVAAAATMPPLLVLAGSAAAAPFTLLLQANLLAQCATALLVAASASWIRVSELRYRQVVVHNPVVIYSARVHRPGVVGRPGVEVTLVSAASDGLLGCPPEDLLGDFDRWLERVHEDDRVVVRAALTQLERQTEPVVCEYRLAPAATANGAAAEAWNLESDAVRAVAAAAPGTRAAAPAKVRWVRDTLAPNFDADGRLCGWEGVLIEVTGQRALADDLRRTTSLFHALVASLPAGVFFVQGTRARPILVNARARQLLGQREDVAAGLEHLSDVYRLHRLDGSPYPVEELPVVRALRRGLTTLSADVVVHRPDGRRMTLMSWAAPVALEGPGAAPAAVWVFEDLKLLHSAEATGREGGAAVSRNG